mgnify:CR=1 FL=1
MTTTQGITTASGTRIRRIAQMNALADVVVNVYAPVMKQGSIIVTPTASAETTCSPAPCRWALPDRSIF